MSYNEELKSGSKPNERVFQVELLISNLLRTGVIVSVFFVVIGTVISFLHHPDYVSSSAELGPLTELGSTFPHTLPGVVHSAFDLNGPAIVLLGLLLLIATPVMRVAVSIFAFLYQGDRLFTFITLTVLGLLLLSFVLGRALN